MSFRTEVKISVTVRDPLLPPPGLEALEEKDVDTEDLDEFVEMLLTVPFTALNSSFSNGKLIEFSLAGLNPRQLFIRSSGPIGVVQYLTTPHTPVLQPCRSLLVMDYDPLNPMVQMRLLNLNADSVDVKLLISSKN